MENIDLAREMRARLYRECRERGQFSSRDKAASAFSVENVKISASSLKDFETGKRTPSPNLVLDMARVYQTPELKWLHCSTVCPIGLEIYKKGAGLGTEDIYRTYFELAGAFDRINDVVTPSLPTRRRRWTRYWEFSIRSPRAPIDSECGLRRVGRALADRQIVSNL